MEETKQRDVMQTAQRVAKEEGYSEGKLEGEKQKSIEIAKNLIKLNLSLSDIAKATELSTDEIEKIKEEMKEK